MKFFGRISDPKDVTTKEYVDSKFKELDESKVNSKDIEEYTPQDVESLWSQLFNTSSNTSN